MANMSYCRFENTYKDLLDCYHSLDEQLSGREHEYREMLVELCQSIVDEYDPLCQDMDDYEYDEDETA